MLAQYDIQFTGQLVFALTALLGLTSLGVKLFGRKPDPFISRSEFNESRRELARELELLRTRLDDHFERLIQRLDEQKTEIVNSSESRVVVLHERVNQLHAQLARLDDRT